MVPAWMIGLLPDGEAVYTDTFKSIEEQKRDALKWPSHYDLISVHAVVGGTICDITAAYCRMWVNNADLSTYEAESDFPELIRDTVPELISEALAERREALESTRDLRAAYHASVL